jgi:hypothetical protein
MTLPIVLLTLLFWQTQLAQGKKSSIEGVVLQAGSNEPIEDAVVILAKAASEFEVSVTTDSLGRFVFKDLDAATYRLAFESIGHVRQEYGQRAFPGNGTPLTLAEGQALKNIVVHLTPTGSVSGRILDNEKLPLAGVPVRLMRFSYNEQGEKTLLPSGSARTDDRGEYRIYFVTPGRYYLNAGTPSSPRECWEYYLGPNEAPEPYASAYYPGVADLKFASIVDVQPAADVRGIGLTLARAQFYQVRGRIIDTATGQPPAYAEHWLTGSYARGCSDRFQSIFRDGNFEFRNVAPGSYTVGASVVSGEPIGRRVGRAPVEVVDSDLDGIVLTVSAGVSVSGRVRVEGSDSSQAAFSGDDAWVVLGGNSAHVNADGTFRIDNVLPGEYRVYSPRLKPPFYMKQARYGVAEALSEPLRIAGPDSSILDILLSSNVGAIDGTAAGPLGPSPSAQVVLVPEKSRHRHELFRAVTADQNGRFSIPNIAPGAYKLFAWETIEPYSWFDPEVFKRYESRGRSINVAEGSMQTIEVRTISLTP